MQGAIFEVKFEPVCCKKRPKIVPDQLLVWGIICTFKLNLLHKELIFADFDLIGLPFQAVVVITLGCDFLFKSILGHCDLADSNLLPQKEAIAQLQCYKKNLSDFH